MLYKINFSRAAELDFIDALTFYALVSDKIKNEFVINFKNRIITLQKTPKMYQLKYKNIRIALLSNFPIGLHFIIEEDHIFILRILHTSRSFK
jgi:plasmid stabilization system protein ParE